MKILLAALSVFYPLLAYVSLQQSHGSVLLPIIVALALLRSWRSPELIERASLFGLCLVIILSWWVLPAAITVKLYPVLMNLVMLIVFGSSLWQKQTVIERIARLKEKDLPPAGVLYTRRVTQVWCVFFLVNGAISLGTALLAGDKLWTLYNGGLAYLLMGGLFSGEWLVRRKIRGREELQ